MREFLHDFMVLDERPDGTVRISLGTESERISGLREGERVRLLYPGNLEAEGIAHHDTVNGFGCWYVELPSMKAIQVIDMAN